MGRFPFTRYDYLSIYDEVMCYDNSDLDHPLIFSMEDGVFAISNEMLYECIQQQLLS